jgi:hypothetical protein
VVKPANYDPITACGPVFFSKKEQIMICPECLGKKGEWVGMRKCDGFGIHVIPGTDHWEPCARCHETGEVPDSVIETGKCPNDEGDPS